MISLGFKRYGEKDAKVQIVEGERKVAGSLPLMSQFS